MRLVRYALVVLVAAIVVAAPSAATRHARVWVVSPHVVAGSGFPAGKVRVTVTSGQEVHARVVRATRAGRFTARFATPVVTAGCQTLVVRAAGRLGVAATRQLPASSIDCPQPPSN